MLSNPFYVATIASVITPDSDNGRVERLGQSHLLM